MKALLAVVAVLLLCASDQGVTVSGAATVCSQNRDCSSCIQSPGCAWCADVDFEHTRCLPSVELESLQCSAMGIQIPTNSYGGAVKSTNTETVVNPISIVNVTLNLAVGGTENFTVEVKPDQNAPLDLYILMDLSGSMLGDLNSVKAIAADISSQIQTVTTNVRLGFGTFNDKPIPPFTRIDRKENTPQYSFLHRITLTSNIPEFAKAVNESLTTTNIDTPENGLEALLQVLLCEKTIGWRDRSATNENRGLNRVVLFITDDQFHYAGEGRYAGIIRPSDKTCRLESYPGPNGTLLTGGGQTEFAEAIYNAWDAYDYPSVGLIAQVLRQQEVIPIFAVDSAVLETYKNLADFINTAQRATVASLEEDSTNLLDVINNQLTDILRNVELRANPSPHYSIDVTAMCPGVENDGACEAVGFNETARFNVKVTLNSCELFGDSTSTNIEVRVPGFGGFNIIVNGQCSCDCENTPERESDRCNGRGDLTCGICNCFDGWCGIDCSTSTNQDLSCMADTDGRECSDRGVCECKECFCNAVTDEEDIEIAGLVLPPGVEPQYFGVACQCSNFENVNCPVSSENGYICGGSRGSCGCDGCVCNKDPTYNYEYQNADCGCPVVVSDCFDVDAIENATVLELCNREGMCMKDEEGKCKCQCNDAHTGDYCEMEATTIPLRSCPTGRGFEACVVEAVDSKNADLGCPTYDFNFTFDESDLVTFTACQTIQSGDCRYSVFVGTENEPVLLDRDRSCTFPSWIIAIIVVAGIIILGIVILIIVKIIFVLLDYVEVKRWQRDLKEADFSKNQNPLYQSPETKYMNVAYGKAL